MQSDTPLLEDPQNLFLQAIVTCNTGAVKDQLIQGFDPNFVSERTLLTPLGTACQILSFKFKALHKCIEDLESQCCGYLHTSDLEAIKNDINHIKEIIMLLVEQMDPPSTVSEWAARANARTKLEEYKDYNVAQALDKSLSAPNLQDSYQQEEQ
jgi:hypothetical protein